MSRCFPYPPPGYSRNGATYEALIESIKLQKENDKSKSERKKEKRAKKEKKEKKEKRKDSEKSKLQKNPNESQQDSHSKQFPPLNIKRKEPAIEQLEKSDLTEEHGQPVDSHKPSYSSDSTQNSNKRKRDDPVVPDESNHVKPIKIRLFKKQKGPDSIKETSCSVSGRIDQQNLSKVPSVQSNSNSINVQRTPIPIPDPVSSNRKSGIPATSTSYDRKQSAPLSLQSIKGDVAVLHSSTQQQPIPIPGYRRPLEHVIPSPSPNPPSAPSVSRKLDASMVSSSGRMSTDEIKLQKKKDPINEIPLNVGPTTRFEKKLHKKHLKYEKLIGSWVPPVLEAQVAGGGGDDDWLLGSRKTRVARSAMKDDVETCREMTWQPCARFLVEADVYALPYTVPF
ncbi:unnamed protein product [Lactuca virosa]|uniref:Uncharacterized protein n=1 Tax=Lactuca virosa TaxID=75947 RepID=A0AAU9MWX7_9ASTR|nr:unnamed protein product [Lactuca virosa]